MSFAYKLWRIGTVLKDEDIIELMNESSKIPSDSNYLNINFVIENGQFIDVEVNEKAVSKENLFLTSKIGGTSNAYYLYPNIITGKNDKPLDKLKNLENTLKESALFFSDEQHKKIIEILLDNIDKVKEKLKNYSKGEYIFFISINNETIYTLMPEILKNWVKFPFFKDENIVKGRDVFTNIECEVGYSPDVKVFSYDNYHDNLKYRVTKNYALSKESARNIKFGWLFCMQNLFFSYKYKEYCIIPNMIVFDNQTYKEILDKFKALNKKDKTRNTEISKLIREEKELEKELKKVKKEEDKIEIENKLKSVKENSEKIDISFLNKEDEELEEFGDFANMIVLDYYFFELDRKNKSFRIKGAIEDVVPSRIRHIVEKMRELKIEDHIIYKYKGKEGFTYLKNYFNRKELEIFYKKGFNGLKDMANTVLKDRIYLAKLLLTNQQIKFDDILQHFEYHREYDYEGKRKVKDGVKNWIEYSNSYRQDEDKIIQFFYELGKIKE